MSTIRVTGPKGTYQIDESKRAEFAANGYTETDTMSRIRGLDRPDSSAVPSFDGIQRDMSKAAQASAMRAPDSFGDAPAPSFGKVARDVLPTVAAAAGAAVVPEALPVAWLLKALAAGTSSGLADAGIQTARGEVPDATSLGRGALDAGGEILGGILGLARMKSAHGLMKSALSVGKPVTDRAIETRSALLGRDVLPHEIDLAQDAITARLAPGKGPRLYHPESGAKAMGETQAELMAKRAQHLADADKRGVTFTRQDFTNGYNALWAEVGSLPNGSKKQKLLQSIMDDYLQQGRVNPQALPNAKGNSFRRIKPSEAEDMKESWAAFAKRAYKGNADETLPILDKFSELIAKNVREKIAGLTPGVGGGPGAIESLNRAYRANLPLEDALTQAEYPRSNDFSLKDLNPVRLASPGVRGRAALMLTEPLIKFGVHNAPRTAGALPFTIKDLLDMAHSEDQP